MLCNTNQTCCITFIPEYIEYILLYMPFEEILNLYLQIYESFGLSRVKSINYPPGCSKDNITQKLKRILNHMPDLNYVKTLKLIYGPITER